MKIEIQLTWVFPFQQYVQTNFVVTQKSNTEHGSNNVVTIVKQLINSIKKRFRTKRLSHRRCSYTAPEKFSVTSIVSGKSLLNYMPIKMYAALSLPRPLMAGHRPHPKNERKKWRTCWYFFLSFGFTVYNSLFNSQCYMKSTAHTAKKLSSYPTCRTERTGVHLLVRERNIPGNLSRLVHCS